MIPLAHPDREAHHRHRPAAAKCVDHQETNEKTLRRYRFSDCVLSHLMACDRTKVSVSQTLRYSTRVSFLHPCDFETPSLCFFTSQRPFPNYIIKSNSVLSLWSVSNLFRFTDSSLEHQCWLIMLETLSFLRHRHHRSSSKIERLEDANVLAASSRSSSKIERLEDANVLAASSGVVRFRFTDSSL